MSRPQKSTIVRLQQLCAGARVPRGRPRRARPGRAHRPRPVVHGAAPDGRRPGCPRAARRSRSSRSGPPSGATSGAPARWSTSCTAGAGEAPSWRRSSSPCWPRGFRVVMFDAPAHGDSDPGPAGPRRTHGVEFGKALDAVFARFGPAEAVVAHSLGAISTYLTLRFGWLSTRRLVLLAPMVAAEPLFDQFQRALGFGARTRQAFDRAPGGVRRDPDGGVRRDVPGRSASTPCPRWWCTTAATARRRTPTRPARRVAARRPLGHHRRAGSPADPAGTAPSCARWPRSCVGEDAAGRSLPEAAVSLAPSRHSERCQAHRWPGKRRPTLGR